MAKKKLWTGTGARAVDAGSGYRGADQNVTSACPFCPSGRLGGRPDMAKRYFGAGTERRPGNARLGLQGVVYLRELNPVPTPLKKINFDF